MTAPNIVTSWVPSPSGETLTQGFEVMAWIETCAVHTEGRWRGQPFRLLDWEKRLLLELFTLEEDPEWTPVPGVRRTFRNGLRRRYREAFVTCPKKNGKTELADAIAAYLLMGDGEPSPKGVIAAGSLKQAGFSFRGVGTMIRASPVLRQLASERDVGDLVIEIPSIPGSRLERVAAESGTNDGPSLSFGLLDEVHEYKGEQGRRVHGVITNAGAARDSPLFVSISTVGVDAEDEEQVWVDLWRRGWAAAENPAADPTFYFFCAQAPPDGHWQDRATWEAANPSAGTTVTWPFYQAQWPKGEAWCARYYLNRPPGRVEDAWMPDGPWEACEGDVVMRADLPTFVRVDIDHDHRAAAVAVAQRQGDRLPVRTRVFPSQPLPDGEYLSVAEIEDHLRQLARRYPGRVMAPKRFHGTGRERLLPVPGPEISYHGSFFEGSAQTLRADGLALIDIPNSQERLGPAAESLMELVVNGRLIHDGDPVLASQVRNVVAKQDPKGWRIQPPTGQRRRIVAARAAMIAADRAVRAPAIASRAMAFGTPR